MGFIQLTTEFLLSSTVWHIGHAINICRMNEYVSKMVIDLSSSSLRLGCQGVYWKKYLLDSQELYMCAFQTEWMMPWTQGPLEASFSGQAH